MKEPEWIEFFKNNIDLSSAQTFSGQNKKNQILPVPNCEYKMQFGDFRIELPNKTIVIEIDSAGGIPNFLKYWPYLSGHTVPRPKKPFALVHIYGSSYPTHKSLWWFFRSRIPSLLVKSEFILFEDGEQNKNEIVEKIIELMK